MTIINKIGFDALTIVSNKDGCFERNIHFLDDDDDEPVIKKKVIKSKKQAKANAALKDQPKITNFILKK